MTAFRIPVFHQAGYPQHQNPLLGFSKLILHVCQGLNSHYFHIIGDGHQPNIRGLYTHYKDSAAGAAMVVAWALTKRMPYRQITPPTKNGSHGSRLFHQWPLWPQVATYGIQGAPAEPRHKRTHLGDADTK